MNLIKIYIIIFLLFLIIHEYFKGYLSLTLVHFHFFN
jgi:hypothetical protein